MVRKTIFAAVALSLMASAAAAQDFDDRWMLTPYAGANFADHKRNVDDALVLGLGFGRFISPRFMLEFDINGSDNDFEVGRGSWETIDFGINGRLFFANIDTAWRPYATLGIRSIQHDRDGSRDGSNAGAHLGLGVLGQINERLSFRGDAIWRYDTDDESLPNQDDYNDILVTAGLSFALGETRTRTIDPPPPEEPVAEVPPPPAEPAPADDDGDGVPNDIDKCPNSTPGAMVDRDGCEVAEVIDLRGVNFDFDKCNLRPDAVEILDNAIGVLKSQDLRVSVEGHTDWIGTDAYNQRLSECRAKVVYDYLLQNGVSESQLTGTRGFGETQPIDTNETAEGRARNRRTELKRN